MIHAYTGRGEEWKTLRCMLVLKLLTWRALYQSKARLDLCNIIDSIYIYIYIYIVNSTLWTLTSCQRYWAALTPAEGWFQYKMNSMANRSAVTPPTTPITLTSIAAYLRQPACQNSTPTVIEVAQSHGIAGSCAHHLEAETQYNVLTVWVEFIVQRATKKRGKRQIGQWLEPRQSSQAMPRGEWDNPGSRAKPHKEPNPPIIN